jgi:hypothetical protein
VGVAQKGWIGVGVLQVRAERLMSKPDLVAMMGAMEEAAHHAD